MERVDFDRLCKQAYVGESSVEDKDNLWLEVFKLPMWYFIARGPTTNVYPYIAQANLIEPHSDWLFAFTDSSRATFYAQKNQLYTDEDRPQLLSIPNNDNLIPWIQQFNEVGVKGVYFNADGHGFFVPITQLLPIREHLTESYPAAL